jgi:predicted RNase H-like HicB family nuclease
MLLQHGKEVKVFQYAVLIYYSFDHKSYIAEVPELQGCMASGISYEDAVSKIIPVIGEWIKNAKVLNREIPEPQGRLKVQVQK